MYLENQTIQETADCNIVEVPYCSDEVLKEIIKKNPGKKFVNPAGKELILNETRGQCE